MAREHKCASNLINFFGKHSGWIACILYARAQYVIFLCEGQTFGMGSSAFDVADLGWLWPGNRGRATGEDAQKILFAYVFNTLPVLFERSSFVIARELPPWSEDLLEDTYLRKALLHGA
jgi:hypothetical protein